MRIVIDNTIERCDEPKENLVQLAEYVTKLPVYGHATIEMFYGVESEYIYTHDVVTGRWVRCHPKNEWKERVG